MKPSSFLFLKLFLIACLLLGLLALIPYAHTLMLAVKACVTQTSSPMGTLDRPDHDPAYVFR